MKRQPRERIDYKTWTVEQFKEDLKTKQEYLDYFAQFDPETIEAFVNRYAGIKYQMFQNQDGYKWGTESFKVRFIELADKCIDYILQKKLFNLQCQWRANLIDLPLVAISRDFDYWSRRMNNLFRHPYTKIEFLMAELQISKSTAIRYLDLLIEKAFLKKYTVGKHTFYVNQPLFDLFKA